ncbi:uncharacterized protein LOC126885309 [Diabrotica virgifera virgifera]|uniref:Endonuclease/exonuclease/phosphatase domain-containing protein n=1 Tax=Diabrotica virgifera virgifera TaxID=50390 RepID=A0ABM5KC76_DIAVI|nr:uncharacterized protein LOC126885309 [Diabrotica virgifera virgifera]
MSRAATGRDVYFKIICVNAQSITNKSNRIELILSSEDPDVLCVSETWCSDLNKDIFCFQNYNQVASYTRKDKCHGGVSIYIKYCLFCKPQVFLNTMAEELHFECCVTFSLKDGMCCLINIYRAPSGDIEIFVNKLYSCLNYCFKHFKTIILCGDFNIDYLKDSREKVLFTDLIQSFNLKCKNKEPTRIFTDKNGKTSKSKLDYFLTNWPHQYKETTKDFVLGDHLGLEVLLIDAKAETGQDKTGQNVTFRNLSHSNVLNLQSSFSTEYFKEVYEFLDDVNLTFETFLRVLTYHIDISCPMTSKIIRNEPKNSWVTNDTVQEGNDLRILFWLSNNLENIDMHLKYKEKKKQYVKLIDEAKKSFFQNSLECKNTIQQKQKFIWRTVNNKTDRKTKMLSLNDSPRKPTSSA